MPLTVIGILIHLKVCAFRPTVRNESVVKAYLVLKGGSHFTHLRFSIVQAIQLGAIRLAIDGGCSASLGYAPV